MHISDLGYIMPTYLSAVVEEEDFLQNRGTPQCAVATKPTKPINWKKIDCYFKMNALAKHELDVMIYEKNKIPPFSSISKIAWKFFTADPVALPKYGVSKPLDPNPK